MSRQPFRLFADFTGADPRFRRAPGCPECGTPLDEVPLRQCATHRALGDEDPARPPQLAMDERPFAPPDAAQ